MTRAALYWSMRRELWENRSIVIAPPVAGAVVLLGFLLGTRQIPARMRTIALLDPSQQADALAKPFVLATIPIFLTMLVVGIVYCYGALYAERRDRSILFWKSLPVSDLTTVLSKAAVPFFLLPLITFGVIVVTQFTMLLLDTAILALNGVNAAPLWTLLPFVQIQIVFLYGLAVLVLWNAPITAWLLLVSAWARRTPFLWAISPLALCAVEGIAFHTGHLAHALFHHLTGAAAVAFADQVGLATRLAQLDPGKFVTIPDLWIGLAIAAAFIAATVWLRRTREPS